MSKTTARFIKLDVHGNLFGSLRYDLSPAEYSIWDRLLLLAKICKEEGVISSTEWKPDGIVALFNLAPYGGLDLYKTTIDKLVKTDRIQILNDGSLLIVNWHKYQDVPKWVLNKRNNLYKKVAINNNKDKVLKPSSELVEVVNKLESNTNKLVTTGVKNG